MTQLVSQAEYARHRGVSRKTVTIWKGEGRLVFGAGGKVDVEASDARLDERNAEPASQGNGGGKAKGNGNTAKRSAGTQSKPAPTEVPPEVGEGLASLMDRLELMTTHQAERVKENYLALKHQLDYDQKAGRVVPVDQVRDRVAGEYAKVRNRLLALPTEMAPRIAHLTDANEIRDVLLEGVTEALAELTQDGGSDGDRRGDDGGDRPVH